MRSRVVTTLAAVLVAGAVASGCDLPDFSVGDDVRIREEGLTTITVAVDEDAWDDLQEAFSSEDEVGYASLIVSERVFTVNNGTLAIVLDKGFAKTKVRITSGEHRGEAGYVPTDWVEKR